MGNQKKLSQTRIKAGLKSLKGWKLVEGRLEKTYSFKTYPQGLAFAIMVALDAEKANHHPDSLDIRWGAVKVAYITHSAGGLTDLDLAAARRVEGMKRV